MSLVPSCLGATLLFLGNSKSSINIPRATPSIQEWLQLDASNPHLLGTLDVMQKQDGIWRCWLLHAAFLGLDLIPVFWNRINQQNPNTITVNIVRVTMEIVSKQSSANCLVASIMKKATFAGKSVIDVRWGAG